jgi:hypothetical protein
VIHLNWSNSDCLKIEVVNHNDEAIQLHCCFDSLHIDRVLPPSRYTRRRRRYRIAERGEDYWVGMKRRIIARHRRPKIVSGASAIGRFLDSRRRFYQFQHSWLLVS